MKIWERKPPGTLWATPDLLRDSFTFFFLYIYSESLKWWDQLRDIGVKERGFRSKVMEFYLLWPIRMRSRDLEEEILHFHTSHLLSWRVVETQELLLKNGIPRFCSSFAMKILARLRWQFLPTHISREEFLEAGHRVSSPFLEKQLNGKKQFLRSS